MREEDGADFSEEDGIPAPTGASLCWQGESTRVSMWTQTCSLPPAHDFIKSLNVVYFSWMKVEAPLF